MHQTVDAAEVDECAEVDDRGNGALEAHALGKLLEDFSALVLAAFLKQHTTGQNDVVAVAIHLDDASFDLRAEVHVEILHAAKVDQRRGEEATKTDVEDEAALDDFDNLARNNFAGLELLFDADPGTLVLGALLGKDQTAVLVLLLENESFDLIAESDDIGRIGILADGQLAGRDNAFALESDINENFVALDLDNGAVGSASLRMDSSRDGITPSLLNPISTRTSSRSILTTVPSTRSPSSKSVSVPSISSFICSSEMSEKSITEVFLISVKTDPFRIRGPFAMIDRLHYHVRFARGFPRTCRSTKHVSGAYTIYRLHFRLYKPN